MPSFGHHLRCAIDPGSSRPVAVWGVSLLRVITGGLIFHVHGLHKVEQGIAFLREGTPWKLVEEIAEMGAPAPVATAFFATAVQFVCAPLLALGLGTRINALVLTGVLGGAVLQNLLAGRDPQLALLYTLNVAVFVLIGGGPLSLDARIHRRSPHRR